MNIYRQLAENVWNPKVSSGADIQRMLDMMDKFQSSAPTSNIGYAMPGGNQMQTPQMNQDFRYGGESIPSPALEGEMADRSNPWGEIGYGLFGIPSQAGKAAFPSPTTMVGKGLSKGLNLGANLLAPAPIPNFWGMVNRQFANPLISAIEGLFGYGKQQSSAYSPTPGYGPSSGYSVPGSFDPSFGPSSGYSPPGGYDPASGFTSPATSFSSAFSPDQFGMMDFGMGGENGEGTSTGW